MIWEPIINAPIGEPVLVWNGMWINLAISNGQEWYAWSDDTITFRENGPSLKIYNPSHWMRLPKPPGKAR